MKNLISLLRSGRTQCKLLDVCCWAKSRSYSRRLDVRSSKDQADVFLHAVEEISDPGIFARPSDCGPCNVEFRAQLGSAATWKSRELSFKASKLLSQVGPELIMLVGEDQG
jgi:hypothetical protein